MQFTILCYVLVARSCVRQENCTSRVFVGSRLHRQAGGPSNHLSKTIYGWAFFTESCLHMYIFLFYTITTPDSKETFNINNKSASGIHSILFI